MPARTERVCGGGLASHTSIQVAFLDSLPTAVEKGKGKAKKGSSFQTVSALHRVSLCPSPSPAWLPSTHQPCSFPPFPCLTPLSPASLVAPFPPCLSSSPFSPPSWVASSLPVSHLTLTFSLAFQPLPPPYPLCHSIILSVSLSLPSSPLPSLLLSPSLALLSPPALWATGKSEQADDQLALHAPPLRALHHPQRDQVSR